MKAFKCLPIFIKRVHYITDLIDEKNDEKNGWSKPGNDSFKMQERNDSDGKLMIKCEKTVNMDFINIYCVLYEDDFYIDWVSSSSGLLYLMFKSGGHYYPFLSFSNN